MKSKSTRASSRVLTRVVKQHSQNRIGISAKNTNPPTLPPASFTHSVETLLRAFTHSAVTLTAMYHGLFTNNQVLIAIACALVAPHTFPSMLRGLFDLLKGKHP